MARTAGKKQAPAKVEEDDDADGWEDAVVDPDEKDSEANLRLRDWRDVERFREMKELRRLVDDDYGLEEIFHIPLKPRAEPGIPAPRTPAKPTDPKAARNAHAPAKAAKPAAKVHAKVAARKKPPATPAPSGARARNAGLKAKAKRK